MRREISYVNSGEKHPNLRIRTSLIQSPTLLPNVLQKVNPDRRTFSREPVIPGTKGKMNHIIRQCHDFIHHSKILYNVVNFNEH